MAKDLTKAQKAVLQMLRDNPSRFINASRYDVYARDPYKMQHIFDDNSRTYEKRVSAKTVRALIDSGQLVREEPAPGWGNFDKLLYRAAPEGTEVMDTETAKANNTLIEARAD